MLAEIPAPMLDEWRAYAVWQQEEFDKSKRRTEDQRKTEDAARRNAH